MIKRILLTGLTLLALGLAGPVLQAPQMAFAQSKNDVCAGIGATSGKGCSATGTSVNDVISAVITIISTVVGVVAVIMIVVAGFRYVTSGGDAGKVTSAKNTLIYAIVGLVVAGFAQFIVKFVLHKIGI